MDDVVEAPSTNTVMDRVFGGQPTQSEGDTPTPTATETTEETKVADAPVSDEKDTAAVETKPEVTEPAKEQAETNDDKSKVEAKAEPEKKLDWDSDDNPHKKRADEIAKREKAARDWATQINQRYINQQRELEIINKKLDGTYDPTVDEPKIDPQQVLSHARTQGAVQASIAAVTEKLGEEKTKAELDRFNQLFDDNDLIQKRVLNSPSPMAEAMQVLAEYDVTQKYGSRDVKVLIEKIKAEAVVELREQIRKEEHQKILDGIAMKNKTPNGNRDMRRADGDTKPAGPRPLSSFFNN